MSKNTIPSDAATNDLALMLKAATECGIEVAQALKFIQTFSMLKAEADGNAVQQPKGVQ
jgi:hypothetical protein